MKRKLGTCIVSLLMTAAMVWHAPLMALAGEYYIDYGNITITAPTAGSSEHTVTYYESAGGSQQTASDTAPVIKQNNSTTPTTNTVTVTAGAGQTANVTLQGVNIDTSVPGTAAFTTHTQGDGTVNIELNENNSLISGFGHAGLEKTGTGYLTITDTNGDGGSLTATGGRESAGIGGQGGGVLGDAFNITISGGTVTATGGEYGAGIGGGFCSAFSYNITINGGTVTATGGKYGAGIGGGYEGIVDNITISGDALVTAAGGTAAAGIGGGAGTDYGVSVTIRDNAQVKASGGAGYYDGTNSLNYGSGAAIGYGGDYDYHNSKISVNGTDVTPDTTELMNGSVSLYAPGTDITAMQDPNATPVQTISGNGGGSGSGGSGGTTPATPVTPGTTPATPGTTPATPGTTPATPGTTPATPGTMPVIPGTMPVIPVMSAFSGTGSGGSATPATPTASVKSLPQTKQNFDSKYYADNNPDLYEAYGYDHDLLWNHYVTYGRQEGRKARFVEGIHSGAVDEGKGKEDFDAIAYADYYADLFAIYGYDEDALWNHYDTIGRAEGRLYFARQVS